MKNSFRDEEASSFSHAIGPSRKIYYSCSFLALFLQLLVLLIYLNQWFTCSSSVPRRKKYGV